MSSFICYMELEQELRSEIELPYLPAVRAEGPGAIDELPPDTLVGIDQAIELFGWLRGVNEETPAIEITSRLETLRGVGQIATKLSCPRVFVSHRSADAAEALRIAELAGNAGFYYWVDVLDPALQALGAGSFNSTKQAVAVAIVIELALLNCSHVIAVLTKNTPGSMWGPYEYGRVKLPTVTSIQASAWIDPTWNQPIKPEYLLLGRQHQTETEIINWFAGAINQWPAGDQCNSKPWPHGPTTQLPTSP